MYHQQNSTEYPYGSGSPVVYHHVQSIIYEVANGEADEGVAGGLECGYQVVLHLRGLPMQLNSHNGEKYGT